MIEPKLIIDYRERHPNLRALSDSGAVLSHQREILGIFPYFPVQAIAISHRRGPIFSALTLFTQNAGDWGGKASECCPKSSDFAKTLSKARHPSSPKWPLLLLLQILHPISPNIANTSSPRETCHLPKMKAKYIERQLCFGSITKEQLGENTQGATKKQIPQGNQFLSLENIEKREITIFSTKISSHPRSRASLTERATSSGRMGSIIWESMENGARWSLQMLSMARSLQNTNALNGEDMGRDARAICPSLILASFQFIPEISSVSNGENNVFPKYVFFYVMYYFFFVKVSFHVFIPFLPPLTSGFDLCPT